MIMRSKRDKEANSLYTNMSQMARSKDNKYDVSFLYYCLNRISSERGQSLRYLMCKFIKDGLEADPEYSAKLSGIRRDYLNGLASTVDLK